MSNPLISVIVPVYKVELLLERCVRSLQRQTHENLEIILVDDGSPDGCGSLCDGFAAEDPRIRVIHKENGGLSSARNAGLDIARGEYIAFVDSDDWVEPRMYETMLALAVKYDVKLVCAGRYDVSEKTGEKTPGLCPKREEKITGEALAARIFRWEGLDSAAWDKLYHRSLLEEIRYPVGKIVEDVPTTYRIALKAGAAVLCPQSFYNYFHRAGSITTEKAVTEKTFHFSQHTAAIYPEIRENWPSLEPQAAYLRVRSLTHLLLTLEQAKPEDREKFHQEYRAARKDLEGFWRFVLKSPWFSPKEKATCLLLILGLYRQLRPIFHR